MHGIATIAHILENQRADKDRQFYYEITKCDRDRQR
jgi:hypothetical protein